VYLQSFDNRQCCGFARHNKAVALESEQGKGVCRLARTLSGRKTA